ncbi:MAG: NTP transferase domain-containing protein [Planctomycetaceae bacterium]|nr:NTP transferase domain-containing protein [Planctomycetaceae bacterium]
MTSKKHNVVIFAAGKGSRLNIGLPKSLANIEGQRLFELQLKQLSGTNCAVYVVCGYKANALFGAVSEFLESGNVQIPVVSFIYNPEYELSQVVSIKYALSAVPLNCPTIFIDGDILFNRETIVQFFASDSTSVLVRNDISSDAVVGDVEDGRLVHFRRDGIGDCEWANIAKYAVPDLEKLFNAANESNCIHHFEIINDLVAKGVSVNVIRGHVAELDTHADLTDMKKFIQSM